MPASHWTQQTRDVLVITEKVVEQVAQTNLSLLRVSFTVGTLKIEVEAKR